MAWIIPVSFMGPGGHRMRCPATARRPAAAFVLGYAFHRRIDEPGGGKINVSWQGHTDNGKSYRLLSDGLIFQEAPDLL